MKIPPFLRCFETPLMTCVGSSTCSMTSRQMAWSKFFSFSLMCCASPT